MEQAEKLSTDQIASAGNEPSRDAPTTQLEDREPDAPISPTTDDDGQTRADVAEHQASLLDEEELDGLRQRWQDIQSAFVDEPRRAMQDADALVAELMQRLAQMFSSERDKLEAQWSRGDQVSTEDLRVGLQRYRSFFERLLAA